MDASGHRMGEACGQPLSGGASARLHQGVPLHPGAGWERTGGRRGGEEQNTQPAFESNLVQKCCSCTYTRRLCPPKCTAV